MIEAIGGELNSETATLIGWAQGGAHYTCDGHCGGLNNPELPEYENSVQRDSTLCLKINAGLSFRWGRRQIRVEDEITRVWRRHSANFR